MRLKLTEDPKEWRKAVWFSALGLALLSSLLRWRRVLPQPAWLGALAALALVALSAWIWPRAFRGWHHFSKRLSFYLIEFVGRVVLGAFFLIFFTPMGLLRLFGQDPLRLKRSKTVPTYWTAAKESTPLDRLF